MAVLGDLKKDQGYLRIFLILHENWAWVCDITYFIGGITVVLALAYASIKNCLDMKFLQRISPKCSTNETIKSLDSLIGPKLRIFLSPSKIYERDVSIVFFLHTFF